MSILLANGWRAGRDPRVLIERRRFRSDAEARMVVVTFIESGYNPRRRHSALGYLSPIEHEERHQARA